MSMYTKGPWVMMDRSEELGTPSFWIGVNHPEYEFVSHAEIRPGCGEAAGLGDMEANALLIAAAPDCFEVLDALLEMYVDLANSGDCGNWDPEKMPEVISARAAIAKAKGA